jgi:hypothetical protein
MVSALCVILSPVAELQDPLIVFLIGADGPNI